MSYAYMSNNAIARNPVQMQPTTSQLARPNPYPMMNQNTRMPSHPTTPEVQAATHNYNHTDRGLRVFTGRVMKVREWMTLGMPFPVVYRMYGKLIKVILPGISSSKKVTGRKIFILEDHQDPSQKIRCLFQEIDRDVGTFKAEESVVVMGRGKGDGTMQVFSVDRSKEEDLLHMARMENFAVRGIRLGMKN